MSNRFTSKGFNRTALICTITSVLVSCQTAQVKPQAEVSEPSVAIVAERRPVKTGKAVMVEQLLMQAESALNKGRLTQPSHDNAYDKFRAVSIVSPSNEAAQAGLDAVLLSLAGLMREDLAKGRLQSAQQTWEVIDERFGGHELTKSLAEALAQAREARAKEQAKQQAVLGQDPTQHVIPKAYLQGTSTEAEGWFADLASTIQAQNASIMIYARSDAEGRKIYQRLKQASPGYLIRGDIRVNAPPRIQLLEPLP